MPPEESLLVLLSLPLLEELSLLPLLPLLLEDPLLPLSLLLLSLPLLLLVPLELLVSEDDPACTDSRNAHQHTVSMRKLDSKLTALAYTGQSILCADAWHCVVIHALCIISMQLIKHKGQHT